MAYKTGAIFWTTQYILSWLLLDHFSLRLCVSVALSNITVTSL